MITSLPMAADKVKKGLWLREYIAMGVSVDTSGWLCWSVMDWQE